MTTLAIRVTSPRAAHQALTELFQQQIKPHTHKGAAGVVTWQTHNTWLRGELRKYLHGVILASISEQVRLPDPVRPGKTIRYTVAAWKLHLKAQFGCLDSTEDLSDDAYAQLVREVEAHAVVDLGVLLDPDEVTPLMLIADADGVYAVGEGA